MGPATGATAPSPTGAHKLNKEGPEVGQRARKGPLGRQAKRNAARNAVKTRNRVVVEPSRQIGDVRRIRHVVEPRVTAKAGKTHVRDESKAGRVHIGRATLDKTVKGALVINVVQDGTILPPRAAHGEVGRSGCSQLELADLRLTHNVAAKKLEQPVL